MHRSQTIEDTDPVRFPTWTVHHEGTSFEYIREEVSVRRPYSLTDFEPGLVLRHSQVSTRITIALEEVPTE